MQSPFKISCRSAGANRGLSFIEFIGCLAALGGGMVLGSIYLGVDVQAVAIDLCEKADIKVPALISAEATASESAPAQDVTSQPDTAGDEKATLPDVTEEPGTVAGATESTAEPEAEQTTALSELTHEAKLRATEAAWIQLDEAIRNESTNRGKSGHRLLYDFMLHRKQGHEQVVATIEQIDRRGADTRLIGHLDEILAWHRTGVDLYDRATQILAELPGNKLPEPFATTWQTSATQHRMEEKLILNKHAAMASYMKRGQK